MAEENKNQNIDPEKQEKLKNEAERASKEEKIKAASPEELRKKLSNKNSDYVFRLQKELERQGQLSSDEAVAKVNKLLPEIVIAQGNGQPANGLYMASPSIKANQILHPEEKPKTPADFPFWQRATDNALFWLAIFMGVYGLLGVFHAQSKDGQNGVLTIASVGIILGLFMAKYNEWLMPKTAGKKLKMSWLRVIGTTAALLVILVVWMWLLNLPGIRVINPILPGYIYVVVAVVAYGARYLFRKKYGITGSAFGTVPPQVKGK